MEHIIAKLLQNFEEGKMSRRQLIQSLTLAAAAVPAVTASTAAAADSTIAKATYLNHVGYQVADYGKSRDWYAGLFGMKVLSDDNKARAALAVGESQLILHNRQSPNAPVIDHICFTIANWDEDKSVMGAVEAELKRRGLEIQSSPRSFDIKDPDGFRVQIGGKEQ